MKSFFGVSQPCLVRVKLEGGKGYRPEDDSWVPAEDMEHAKELVDRLSRDVTINPDDSFETSPEDHFYTGGTWFSRRLLPWKHQK